jgi:WW domain-containing oxidoreductase
LNVYRFSLLTANNISEEYLSPLISRNFVAFMAYNDSKLCNAVIASELDRRWSPDGISCNSVHPGNMVSTDISRHWWFYKILFFLVRPFTKSLVRKIKFYKLYLLRDIYLMQQQAAATTVWGASADDLIGVSGQYLNNCWLCAPSEKVNDENLGKSLWNISISMLERIVGRIPNIPLSQNN